MSDRLLPLEAVMEKVHLKRTKIYALIASKEFPSPVKIGSASRWPESKIEDWISLQIAGR